MSPIIVPGKSTARISTTWSSCLTIGVRTLRIAMMMMIPRLPWEKCGSRRSTRFYPPPRSSSSRGGPRRSVQRRPALSARLRSQTAFAPRAGPSPRTKSRLLILLASEDRASSTPTRTDPAKGRRTPGMMFFVETVEGRIVDDA